MKTAFIVLTSPLLLVGIAIFVAASIVKNHVDAKDTGSPA